MLEIKSIRSREFHSYFEKLAPNYSKYRRRYQYFWRNITKYCNYYIQDENSVIEIGCGNGDSLAEVKGKEKVGIDFSSKMIEEAKKNHPEIEFHHMLAEEISLDKKYDVVLLTGVLGYFDNVLDVLNSIKKLCHSRTRIIISYYNHFWEPILRFGELFGIKKRSPRKNWLTRNDIANLLYLADFESFRTTRSLLIPINIPLLSYIFNRYFARLPFFNLMCVNKFINARPIFHQKEEDRKEYSTTVVIQA
ncbi:MAG: glycosyl transferase, partial [Marinilabiliales bacterium]